MNITQGVPRIKEIINAVRAISTPVITAKLANVRDEKLARRVISRIGATTLGLTGRITTVGKSMMVIRPSTGTRFNLCIAVQIMKQDIQNVVVKGDLIAYLDLGVVSLIGISLTGLPNLKRCIISTNEKRGDEYSVIAEGTDFRGVLSELGIDGRFTNCNNPVIVSEVLGIEAARSCIIKEITTTMEAHGITLDRRHVMLLADAMTYRYIRTDKKPF
ncbi:hypothetical protein ANCDUO_12091 [Ancylostoma duodenale]|uniref:DNA-directed RNA polymerase n=1 Tax=Ancylostoma duodenale TaxID=51022 RepID=A0A0C2GKV8_9BILA|nr:hypothetical protein ANCDUO_12091 [Ancylostoma duodenale]